MTTIHTAAGSLYDSLKSESSSANAQKTGSPLLNELTGGKSVQQASKLPAQSSYLLDLSPEAQAFINQSAPTGNAASGQFILSASQQQEIGSVLASYADEPFTKETYDLIEAELDALGLSPDALALKDRVRTLSSTSMMLAAMQGDSSTIAQNFATMATSRNDQLQAKKDHYISTLLGKWSDISTTIDADNGSDS